ncbi:hypothetical protein [Methylogaea oryzae]|uniref:Uncharacterized protein n=1 Tax=Methylogaea oryzae TaxID=1295382 RepID=A0A8D4VRM2_9GAMM|nr:hypothetical protein [Methylogaea oryzae]BBL71125.1 hypothetical protein MoryE10_17310 [Methylogaea oryzae]
MSDALTMIERIYDSGKRCPFTGDFVDNFHFYFLNLAQRLPQAAANRSTADAATDVSEPRNGWDPR